jgi:asparagine synthase (glutamine-hydrolysing)
VGETLGIPIHNRDGLNDGWNPEWFRTSVHTSEPIVDPMNLISDRKFFGDVSAHARVTFWGEGPDNALIYEWRPYLAFLARQRRFGRLFLDSFSQVIRNRRIPWRLIPGMGNDGNARWQAQWTASYPEWLDPDFESRLDLRQRWKQHQQQFAVAASPHPVRPLAYQSFGIPLWQALFEGFDSANTLAPLEVRHPFVDVRLLRFLLAVPVLPWCRKKYLIRAAMKGILPEPVRQRPKSVLKGDPVFDRVRTAALPPFEPASQLRAFVRPNRVPKALGEERPVDFWTNFRSRSLDYWLKNLHQQSMYINKSEKENQQHECLTQTA